MRRVVVTGVGLVTPIGCGSQLVWKRLCEGLSGIHIETFSSIQDIAIATVPRGDSEGDYNEKFLDAGQHKDSPRFIQYGLKAAKLAIENAGGLSEVDLLRAGVCLGSGIGSIEEITNSYDAMFHRADGNIAHRKISPYFIPRVLINMAASAVSIKYGLKGPLHSVATACAAGGHSIGDAYNFIRLNYADYMVAGGTESSVNALSVAGFHRMKALSTIPSALDASRPFDAGRRGFVMGEGAGALVLEELQAAQRRGASILAEVTGYGLSADAHHVSSPCPSGEGARRAMESALADANLSPQSIRYINAHATSTPMGDEIEVKAIEDVFASSGKSLFVSSTKGATGHLLGAAGAIEAAFTVLAVHDDLAPPTLNLTAPSPASFTHVRDGSVHIPSLNHALSNSFGFGGTNCSLIFSKFVP